MERLSPIVLLSIICCCCYGTGAVYVYKGDPYVVGPLKVDRLELSEIFDSAPAHMEVFFPTEPGSYAPVVFVPGLFGTVYTEFYTDVLTQLATHGYIVVGLDLKWPIEDRESYDGINKDPERMLKIINYLVNTLNNDTLVLHGDPGVKADWSVLALGGHSAGCDTILKVIQHNSMLAKAIAFIEPMSFSFTEPLNYSLPALCYGTQLSEETPRCIFPKYDYQLFYKMLQCPKILMNVLGYGHCDILDEKTGWTVCHLAHFCKTDKENDRVLYHTFVSGMLTSFFGSYVQLNKDLLPFITNHTKVPVTLGEFKVETNCSSTQ